MKEFGIVIPFHVLLFTSDAYVRFYNLKRHGRVFSNRIIYRTMPVKEGYTFCYRNALYLTTNHIINQKRKYNCALDIHLYGHVNKNVVDH